MRRQIRKCFNVSRTENLAYVVEFGDNDYGTPLQRCAAFEDVERAKQWLCNAVDDSFKDIELPPPPTAD